MTMGHKGKSNLIQQTHVLIHFVRKALLGTEEGKETEMNEAEVLSSRSSLSSRGESYKRDLTGKRMNQVHWRHRGKSS